MSTPASSPAAPSVTTAGASGLSLAGVTYVAGRAILHGVDLTFEPGRMTALSGPSGSGKTTLLSIAGGLLEPTSGTAAYAGRPMWQGSGDPRPEVAFVLQVYGLVPILSARENVSVALRARGVRPAEADERAQQALARFHIADLGDRQVEELSGGQMQRVALARGLCVGAHVLLADEPTSELDEHNRSLVLAELRVEADRGAVVVVATHDPAVVDRCDAHHVLDEGRLVEPVARPERRASTGARTLPAPTRSHVEQVPGGHPAHRAETRAEHRVVEEGTPPHLAPDPVASTEQHPGQQLDQHPGDPGEHLGEQPDQHSAFRRPPRGDGTA